MATGEVTLHLLNAFKRLVDLLADEEDIPILAPTIQREIEFTWSVWSTSCRLCPRPWNCATAILTMSRAVQMKIERQRRFEGVGHQAAVFGDFHQFGNDFMVFAIH